jgi:tetratricopeptide (TPR) repeat protein
MKTFRFALLMITLAVLAVQCSQDPKARIEKLEKKMAADDFRFDQEGMKVANDLIAAYVEYADSNKTSPDAPAFLFNAGNLAMNLNQPEKSLELFNRTIYSYPDFEKAADCLFLMGFIYENQLQNYGKAIEIYEAFIDKYPDHAFADDARVSIDNMGKPLDELVKEFEEKNNPN